MAYGTRTVRHTLVARAYDLFLDPNEGRQTPLGALVGDAITAGLLAAQQQDGTWKFVKGEAANVPAIAQFYDDVNAMIAGLPRVAVPSPVIAHAATRESNPYSDIIAHGQGALDLDDNGHRFIALDDIATALFERDLDNLKTQFAVTLPIADYQRIQRSLTAQIKAIGTLQSERVDDATLRLWLPSTRTEEVRSALGEQLRNCISAAQRDRVRDYIIQGYGRAFFGPNTSLEASERRLNEMGPTQLNELHHAIGRELYASKQADFGANHDERAARIAHLICNEGAWSVTNNFLQSRRDPNSQKPFPTRPPFDSILDALLTRQPEALGRFESAIRGQLNAQAKDVMDIAERARLESQRAVEAAARRGDETLASDKNRNMAVARAAGVSETVKRELLNDALSSSSRDRYARDPSDAHRLANAAIDDIGAAPTYYNALVRRAIADELRRSLPRDADGRPAADAPTPRVYEATPAGNRFQWQARSLSGDGATHDRAVTGVITALYGATKNGVVRDFFSQLRGPRNVRGVQRWDSALPPFMDHALLAVIQPVIIPRDVETVGRLLRQGFGREVALERMTAAFSTHLRDLRTHDDRAGAAKLLDVMHETASIEAPTNKRAFTNRWCDTTAADLAISLIDKMLHDTTSSYTKETVRILPLNIRTALTDVVFSHVDPETLRSLSRIDESAKFLIDLTSAHTASLDRRNDASETNAREQNYTVYGTPHSAKATPLSTYDSIISSTGKSAYLRDTVAVRLNNDGTLNLALTDARVLLQRRDQRRAADALSHQTLTQDDFLRSMRDRMQQTLGSAYELQFRYSTPTSLSIPKAEQQKLERFRRMQTGAPEVDATTSEDGAEEREAETEDHDVVFLNVRPNQSTLDLFDQHRLAELRAGAFRPTVTVTLHAPEALNPGATYRGHILHSDRTITTIVDGTSVFPLPTSALGTTMETGTFATIVWRDEEHAQITTDPARHSPELAGLSRPAYASVRDIVSHERAALRMILAQNEHEHGPLHGLTTKELGGQTVRATLEVIGANEPHGYAIGRDDQQRAAVLTYEQLGYRPTVGDTLTVDILPDEREGYRIRPIERIAQPTRDPINASYEHAMENLSLLHIARVMNIPPEQIRSYEPPETAHYKDARTIFTSTDLTYFAVESDDGPRIVSAPTFGRLEALGVFGDPEAQARAEFDPFGTSAINKLQTSAKELVSMSALGELRNGYFDKLATMAIPPVPEVLKACETGGATLYFENGKLSTLEPRNEPHDELPHAIFALNGTVSQIAETQRIDELARKVDAELQLGQPDMVHFDATVAYTDDAQAVYLGANTEGRIMITPLDRDLIHDPADHLSLFTDVTLTFDENTMRYNVALRGADAIGISQTHELREPATMERTA